MLPHCERCLSAGGGRRPAAVAAALALASQAAPQPPRRSSMQTRSSKHSQAGQPVGAVQQPAAAAVQARLPLRPRATQTKAAALVASSGSAASQQPAGKASGGAAAGDRAGTTTAGVQNGKQKSTAPFKAAPKPPSSAASAAPAKQRAKLPGPQAPAKQAPAKQRHRAPVLAAPTNQTDAFSAKGQGSAAVKRQRQAVSPAAKSAASQLSAAPSGATHGYLDGWLTPSRKRRCTANTLGLAESLEFRFRVCVMLLASSQQQATSIIRGNCVAVCRRCKGAEALRRSKSTQLYLFCQYQGQRM